MGHIRSEQEAEELIEEMMKKGKGNYITQSVTFRKNNPRQIELLKKALMNSESFSGFVRGLLTEKFNENGVQIVNDLKPVENQVEKKDTGNFL